MAASDNLQLKLFMSPREIEDEGYVPNPNDRVYKMSGVETMPALEARKLQEAKEIGLHKQIEKQGVQKPLGLYSGPSKIGKLKSPPQEGWNKVIANGNHRYEAQKDIDPDRLMPVLHSDHMGAAVSYGQH